MDTSAARKIASDYRIHTADFRIGRVSVDTPDGRALRLTLGELREASRQSDTSLAAVYDSLCRRAVVEIEADRAESIRRCPGHRAITTQITAFCGPVSRKENRAAHGNIHETETCSCGAIRRTNINQQHVERGPWL